MIHRLTIVVLLTIGPLGVASTRRNAGTPWGDGWDLAPNPQAPISHSASPGPSVAAVEGRVVSLTTGAPLRGAHVRIVGEQLPEGRIATTDAEGTFEFNDLPAGVYTVVASKGGYIPLQYGQRRPFQHGRPVQLASGQEIRADFALPRGAVISGTIIDEFGDPVTDATVTALRSRYSAGRRRLAVVGRPDQTDDAGNFRIFGLEPGEYLLRATLRSAADAPDRGGYAATYYPGTAVPADAQRVTVGLGSELPGVTFTLLSARAATLSGQVVTASGRPANGAIVLLTDAGDVGSSGSGMGPSGHCGPDGSFSIANVPPGQYLLTALVGGAAENSEGVTEKIRISGEDVRGLSIVTGGNASIQGRIDFEQTAGDAVKPASVGVFWVPATDDAPVVFGQAANDGVDQDWTFELHAPATPILLRARAPEGYVLRAVYRNGLDVTDTPLPLRPSQTITGVQVVLTSRESQVSGSVTDSTGRQTGDYTVLIYADDDTRWGVASRYIATARPDQHGRYSVQGLPPGDYLALALEYLEEGRDTDPEFLSDMRSRATRFRLADGERRMLDLRATPVD